MTAIRKQLPEARFTPGGIYIRKEIHNELGGQRFGGISTPSKADYAFLFTGEPGAEFGYQDEWVDAETFSYTGEGQLGDMEWARGNLTIVARSPDIHLFTIVGDGLVRYIHQMFYAGHEYREGIDKNGQARRIVVFQLRKYLRWHLEEARAAKQRVLGSTA